LVSDALFLKERPRMKALAQARMAPKALLLVTAALLASLAACETPAPPPPPPPVAEAPPPPPPVLLPSRVIEMAGVYKGYIDRASAIDPSFKGAEAIAASLKAGETYQIGQFQRGETAYGAIVALQDPTFVATLRAFASNAAQRSQVANAIMADPSYATTFKGADSAAGLVIAALTEQGQRVAAVGVKVKQAAYDVQHQSWSKGDVSDRPGRLAMAKSISAEEQRPAEDDMGNLKQAATGTTPMIMTGAPAPPPYTPLVARSLAVAAMAALGEGGEEYTEQLTGLLEESNESSCLHMAKLNLYQCLAVSKPHYEDVFCLGQHILADTGQCIVKGAQVAVYVPPAPVAVAPTAADVPTKPVTHRKKKTSATQ
jgi:hypothetical protein